MGQATLAYLDSGQLVAIQSLGVNLRNGNGAYWSGSPCAGEHLFSKNKGIGQTDNCVTVDAISIPMGSQARTLVGARVTETASGGRYYSINVFIDAEYLGFPNTTLNDWNIGSIQADANKRSALAKLQSWAEMLQEASAPLMNYNHSNATFSAVPDIAELKGGSGIKSVTPRVTTTYNQHGKSYVYCESTKQMILQGQDNCPMGPESSTSAN